MFEEKFSARSQRVRGPTNLIYVVLAVLVVGVLVTLVNIYEMRKMSDIHSSHSPAPVVEGVVGKYVSNVRQPIVWVEGKKMESGYLQHVFNVFERLGYIVRQGDPSPDWDVLWAHDYPFTKLSAHLHNLKPHQKVNHFPGSGFITNKASLAVSKIDFIPTAFKLPGDKNKLLEHVKAFPNKMWVQKSNNHRGIKIKTVSELDLTADGTFVQEYVSKPFLIDERKFDIGIYAVLTSVSPLRIYIVDGDALVRFCPKNYYPFDPRDVDKYVVGDDYTPVWKIPSLEKIYTEKSYTFKETLNIYLRQQGRDVDKLWSDLRSSIRQVYLDKENLISQAVGTKYKSTKWFFEMVRFDFVFDEDLNVYLMEVNMSPNLSSGHFPPNKRLYEHVVFNMLGLVGVARLTTNSLAQSPEDEADMQVSDSDIQVFSQLCITHDCNDCLRKECRLCHQCMGTEQKRILKEAYLEHINRGTCGRIFPVTMNHTEAMNWKTSHQFSNINQLSDLNRFMTLWFIGKCQLDQKWCT